MQSFPARRTLLLALMSLLCACTTQSPELASTQPVARTPRPTLSRATPLVALAASPKPLLPIATVTPARRSITTVFVIVMENHNWSDIVDNPQAPYINDTLLPMASYARHYQSLAGIHPSEPNYLWLEAGTNFGILNDSGPQTNHQSSRNHLVTLLDQAKISWKSYQEGISGKKCPLTSTGLYAPKHNPMLFFDDVTDTNDPTSANCIAHIRPYQELASDLQQGTVARYTFITPNLCHDMHGALKCLPGQLVAQGDAWLAQAVPPILESQAYREGGVLFITWDESEGGDLPIGMIVLSPFAKGGGYSNKLAYTHSSTLRTIQEIFGVTPLLGDAAQATDLQDLFAVFP